MNTRMFPEMPTIDQAKYDNWFFNMLRETRERVRRSNATATMSGRRCVREFCKNLRTRTTRTEQIVLNANYWIKKYKFLPDSIRIQMERYFDKDNFDH